MGTGWGGRRLGGPNQSPGANRAPLPSRPSNGQFVEILHPQNPQNPHKHHPSPPFHALLASCCDHFATAATAKNRGFPPGAPPRPAPFTPPAQPTANPRPPSCPPWLNERRRKPWRRQDHSPITNHQPPTTTPMSRTGKIARLPRHVRDELNLRLHDGQPGKKLLVWLNALPEVQRILAEHFAASPVSDQNLSNWRQGGHADWVWFEEKRELIRFLSQEARDLDGAAGRASVHDRLAADPAAAVAPMPPPATVSPQPAAPPEASARNSAVSPSAPLASPNSTAGTVQAHSGPFRPIQARSSQFKAKYFPGRLKTDPGPDAPRGFSRAGRHQMKSALLEAGCPHPAP
jgi:hypothetical protein